MKLNTSNNNETTKRSASSAPGGVVHWLASWACNPKKLLPLALLPPTLGSCRVVWRPPPPPSPFSPCPIQSLIGALLSANRASGQLRFFGAQPGLIRNPGPSAETKIPLSPKTQISNSTNTTTKHINNNNINKKRIPLHPGITSSGGRVSRPRGFRVE